MKDRFYIYLDVYCKFLIEYLETWSGKKPVVYMLALLAVLLTGESPIHSFISLSNQAPQQSPVIVGEVEEESLRIDYLRQTNKNQTITHPGASFIKVHFLMLDLMPGDYVIVSDPTGAEQYTYSGTDTTNEGESGFWSLSLTGDTAVIKLHSQPSSESELSRRGVVIDKYGWGYPPDDIVGISARSTCGADDERKDVVCYRDTNPTEFEKSNAVARVLVYHPNGYYFFCTAWRVGVGETLLTNQHCLPSQMEVAVAEIWFNYQNQSCGVPSVGGVTKVTGNRLLTSDPALDFSLFTVNDAESIAHFGFLDIDTRTPVLGEQIYIPQHGGGGPKQFGIDSDLNAGNICRIDIPSLDGLDTGTDTGYYCDTAGGSSGSPILASSSDRVIALHHFGNPSAPTCSIPNQGVRMDLIWPHVEPYLLPISPSGSIDSARPVYTWKESSDAIWYYLWVEGPQGNVIKQWYQAGDICSGGLCSVSPNVTMKSGVHTWWIQTWNDAGYGPWSDGIKFTVPPPGKATAISPEGGIWISAPTYIWNEVEGATWYYLWVNGPSGNKIKQWFTAEQANCDGSTCSVTPAQTLSSGGHTWWIQTWSSTGYGPWSDGMDFNPMLPGQATLVAPHGSNEATTPTYTWNEVEGATWYYLWVNGASGTVLQQWYTAAQASCNGATCWVTASTALSSGTYTWWVRTWNTVGYGPWSEGMHFPAFR